MINLEFDDVNKTLAEYNSIVKNIKPEPLYYFRYLHRVLKETYELQKPQYPMEIHIPKPASYLLRGDFEPAQIITIEKPIMMTLSDKEEVPMWFSTTENQAFLRFGFKNLDARFLSDNILSTDFIHGFLGGSSGHGKSVTLNAMLASLCFEYAPWELEVHMSDAKIVEFKKYGVNHIIPHISSIAATEDADFVISVLQRAFDEMTMRNKYFANIGASNLKSFRKKTGLALPRVLILMDEVESTFKLAGKQAGKIADLIDGFARLGRSAGYHVIMATQNMSSDIPKSAVGQIRIRMCLGANQATSDAVLSNNGASENFGRIGRLIVNTEVLNGGKTQKSNVQYQSPFLSDDDFSVEMEFLEKKGQEVGFKRPLAFYDEEDIKTIDEYNPVIDAAIERMRLAGELKEHKTICLGYPAFVTDDEDKLFKINLDGKDIENLLIASSIEEKVAAHLNNLTRSIGDDFSILHFTTSPFMTKYLNKVNANIEIREADSKAASPIHNVVNKRVYLLELEKILNSYTVEPEQIEELIKEEGLPEHVLGNSLFYKRIAAYKATQKLAEYKNLWTPVAGFLPSIKSLYREYSTYNAMIQPLTADLFPKGCIIIGDVSKVIGWGRTPKTSLLNELRKTMQDACRVGMFYVLYARSFDGLTDLNSALRYVIFDSPDKKDWGRLKTEEPRSQSPRLSILYDSIDTQNAQRKFKCTLLERKQ